MGYNTALDLANELDLEVALGYHLQGNHYPPGSAFYGATLH